MQEFDLPEIVTIRELCELALAGNSLCQDILHQAAGRLSRVLANLICLLNPGKLLLGGEITRADRLLFPMLHQSLASQLPAEYLVRLQIESTHFYEDPTKPTSVQVHKALRDGSLLLDLLRDVYKRQGSNNQRNSPPGPPIGLPGRRQGLAAPIPVNAGQRGS